MTSENNIFSAFFRQIVQTQISEFTQDIRQAASNRRAEVAALRQSQLIKQQLDLVEKAESETSKVPLGPKSDKLNQLRD